ncbi:MAG: ComF family protein [Lachnospiraceae bacterium]|nr:ComF family protein [Lachnospiraceae bacterium]
MGLEKTGKILTKLLFPPRCPVCDGIAPWGSLICPGCRDGFRLLTAPWCMQCGKKLTTDEEYCTDCRRSRHQYLRGRALYEYESVADAIYRMKYGSRREYAEYFGGEMVTHLGGFIAQARPDALIPIPLHPRRMRKRGYNQAALLARAVGGRIGVPVREDLVFRIKNTTPLKQQNPAERQNNLKKAFIIKQNDVKLELKSTILIDDIYTTGSTVDEVAGLLKVQGVERIYVLTLACGAGI